MVGYLRQSGTRFQRSKKLNSMVENRTDNWKILYKTGGVAALVVVAFTFVQMFIYFTWPPPSTVIGWFELFQQNWLIGLFDMDLLLMVDYLLLVPVYLALFVLLKKANESLMLLTLVTALLGVAIYFGSGAAFEMLALSNQYSTASSSTQKTIIETAGHITLLNWQGTAFNVSYILGAIAFLLYSLVMLKSMLFSKKTALIGIFAGILMFVPPTVGMIGIIFSLISIIPMDIWLFLVGRRLLQLSDNSLERSGK